jgi:hypothetical protein
MEISKHKNEDFIFGWCPEIMVHLFYSNFHVYDVNFVLNLLGDSYRSNE